MINPKTKLRGKAKSLSQSGPCRAVDDVLEVSLAGETAASDCDDGLDWDTAAVDGDEDEDEDEEVRRWPSSVDAFCS